jgi:hypothetical protein
MCFGLAPGFILREELDGDLEEALAEAAEGREVADEATEGSPSFATDEPATGEALTGSEAEETTEFGGTPK